MSLATSVVDPRAKCEDQQKLHKPQVSIVAHNEASNMKQIISRLLVVAMMISLLLPMSEGRKLASQVDNEILEQNKIQLPSPSSLINVIKLTDFLQQVLEPVICLFGKWLRNNVPTELFIVPIIEDTALSLNLNHLKYGQIFLNGFKTRECLK